MIEYDKHNWLDHLFDIDGSMVREILGRVAACVLWAGAVAACHTLVRPMGIIATPHTLVGLALGLLMVFRTNASYDRYWEGRRLWGSLVNESRNLGRGARAYLAGAPDLAQAVIRWAVALPFATMHHLRGAPGLGGAAAHLPPDEAAAAGGAQHVPLAVALRISETLAAARDRGVISDYVLGMLDRNVQESIDYVGGCERILKTPLPFVYVVHLRRALIVYCFTLPFALVEPFGWWSVLVTLFVSYTFFGIEEIGVEIENPFGRDSNDLPLEQLCTTVEANLLALLDAPALAPAGDGAAPGRDGLAYRP